MCNNPNLHNLRCFLCGSEDVEYYTLKSKNIALVACNNCCCDDFTYLDNSAEDACEEDASFDIYASGWDLD